MKKVFVLLEPVYQDQFENSLDFVAIAGSAEELKTYVDEKHDKSGVNYGIFSADIDKLTHWADISLVYRRKNNKWEDHNWNQI